MIVLNERNYKDAMKILMDYGFHYYAGDTVSINELRYFMDAIKDVGNILGLLESKGIDIVKEYREELDELGIGIDNSENFIPKEEAFIIKYNSEQLDKYLLENSKVYLVTDILEDYTQEELLKYVSCGDFDSCGTKDSEEYVWQYIPDFNLQEITRGDITVAKEWIVWINEEQEMLNRELNYDRYEEINEWWNINPYREPIILISNDDGTYTIPDGNHRLGLSFRNNMTHIPVVLGK